MWIRGTVLGSATGALGKLFRSRPIADATPQHVEMPIPTGVATLDALPSWAVYRSRFYAVGMWTDNLIIDEHFRVHRQGILPPTIVPVATATSSPGRTGSCVICIAFYDEMTDEWSPLSAPSLPVTLANNICITSNIPATSSDPRVSHVGVWVSMNGAAFRLATKRQLGVTSIAESVATLALGMAFPTTFERFPHAMFNAIYHERQLMAGDASNPDVLYVSALFHPERYEGLSFRTRNGEAIVALAATRDICLVMTASGAYGLRGWTEDDMELQPIDLDIGAINHQGIQVIHGSAWIPSPKTLFLYNGAFHDVLKDRRTEWQEFYRENTAEFEQGISVHDPNDATYCFIVRGGEINSYGPSTIPDPNATGPDTVFWTADYSVVQPELGGNLAQPEWNVDVMDRTVDGAGYLCVPGQRRGDVYYGFCDGKSRKKDFADDDDDGDAYGKRLFLRTSAISMGDPGGDVMEGKTLMRLWTYLESEIKAWTLYCKAGDEDAWRMMTPDNNFAHWRDNVAASLFTETRNGALYTFCAKSLHAHKPDRVTGRCLTLEYTVLAPLAVSFRGFGGVWGPGPASRPVISIEEQE